MINAPVSQCQHRPCPLSAGGIGAALVQQFAAAGCSVFASARRLAAMQSLTTLPGVQLVRMDVCSSDSIQAAVAEVVSKAGRVDVLVSTELWGPVLVAEHAAARCSVSTPRRWFRKEVKRFFLELAAVARLCVLTLTPTSCISWDSRRSTTQVRYAAQGASS